MITQRLGKTLSSGIACVTLTLSLVTPIQAEVITIGKGSGILWEGMPFNQTVSGPLNSSLLMTEYGLLSVSDNIYACMAATKLTTINGYLALKLANGVGLIPVVSGNASYTRYNGTRELLNGTIGLPGTTGSSSSDTVIVPPPLRVWCLPPSMENNADFYNESMNRSATLSGHWALVADGTQQAAQVSVPPMFFGSFSAIHSGDRTVQILPSRIDLRISTLECSVSTPTAIDFGPVTRSTAANAELAVKSNSLVVTCGQPSDMITANVNLQFRNLSGLYNNDSTRLALNQGGGYITGEINGVTGSGACEATTGLPFNLTPVTLGVINSTENSKTFTNQLTWRLCSGGSSVPSGAVTASTEMLVTFN